MRLDISAKAGGSRYQSIEVDDIETLSRKRMATEESSKKILKSDSIKEIMKYRRYRSI